MRTLQILLLLLLLLFVVLLLHAVPSDAASRKSRGQTLAAPARVVCGQTGCFRVPPGCRGIVRPSGRTVVAVVVC